MDSIVSHGEVLRKGLWGVCEQYETESALSVGDGRHHWRPGIHKANSMPFRGSEGCRLSTTNEAIPSEIGS